MLPPFVPPGARKAVPELLPSIQDFVADRRSAEPPAPATDHPAAAVQEASAIAMQVRASAIPEQARELSLGAPDPEPRAQESGEELPSEEQLPSIDAFLRVRGAPVEHVTAAEAELGAPMPTPPPLAASAAQQESDPGAPVADAMTSDPAMRASMAHEERETAEVTELRRMKQSDEVTEARGVGTERSGEARHGDTTPAAESSTRTEVPALIMPAAEKPGAAIAPAASASEANWLDAERDSVDWAAAGRLGAPAADDSRAAAEWSATDWDSGPAAGHGEGQQVAAALVQVARRIRGGDLRVEAAPGMSVEAALASALTALLRKG